MLLHVFILHFFDFRLEMYLMLLVVNPFMMLIECANVHSTALSSGDVVSGGFKGTIITGKSVQNASVSYIAVCNIKFFFMEKITLCY